MHLHLETSEWYIELQFCFVFLKKSLSSLFTLESIEHRKMWSKFPYLALALGIPALITFHSTELRTISPSCVSGQEPMFHVTYRDNIPIIGKGSLKHPPLQKKGPLTWNMILAYQETKSPQSPCQTYCMCGNIFPCFNLNTCSFILCQCVCPWASGQPQAVSVLSKEWMGWSPFTSTWEERM